jgi:hypothetical protein
MGHEDLKREHRVESSSDRSFGLVFAIVFMIVAAWPLIHGHAPRWWAAAVAAAFALVAFLRPALLAGLNRLWTRLGLLLGMIVSPIALGVLFYLVMAPIGLLIRAIGKDPLRLKADKAATSYWVPREPPGPPPDSMNNQF